MGKKARKKRLYGKCRQCGRFAEISYTSGLCLSCSIENTKECVRQLREKKGEIYEKWKRRLLGALEKL